MRAAPWVLAFAAVFLLGIDSGGYSETTWGWSVLVFSLVASLVLVLRTARLGMLETALPLALLVFTAWGALSSLWASSATQPLLQSQRTLVYVVGIFAALLVARAATYHALLAGVWCAVALVSSYGLLTRLVPDRLGFVSALAGYRLEQPLGYWNALGVFAAIGIVLALGFAARSRYLAVRALAGASTVPLASTLYFTFSRGSWLALGVGLGVMLAFDRRRLQLVSALLVIAPWPALAAWRASESGPLTRRGTRLEAAAHAGHRFLLVELVLMLAGAAAVIAFARLERRLRPPRPVRIAYAALLVIVVAGALAAVTVRFGSPVTIARKQYPRVLEAGLIIKNGNLNERLFNPSAGQRIPQWKAAWNDYAEHPWLGSGLGSYQRYWNQHSPTYWEVGNAPSLYLETLAELGPVGLGLLLVALLLPIAAAFRARRRALASAATGAYVVFLAHAGIDWDWEMPAVTLAGLLCGAALLVASRERDSGLPSAVRLRRFAALALVLAIASFAFVGLRGNRELAASESAAGRGDVAGAKAAAHAAAGWMPWSARPWQLLGQVELDQHHLAAARVALRKAATIDAADWRTWYDLMLASTGRERRHALAEAARLNPLDPVITAFTGS